MRQSLLMPRLVQTCHRADNTIDIVKRGGDGILLWVCFSSAAKRKLVKVFKKWMAQNAKNYCWMGVGRVVCSEEPSGLSTPSEKAKESSTNLMLHFKIRFHIYYIKYIYSM